MEQLLSIKHVPIKVEVKVQRGEYKPVENNNAPSVQVSAKQGGGLRVQANPYRVDLSENRNYDSYVPSTGTDNGFTLTYEAIAKLADNGNVQGVQNSSQFAAQKSRSIESVLQSLPKNKNNAVSYADGTLSINYQMNNSAVDLSAEMSGFEFVPGSIEFVITQMPELDIEYLGEPIYFPRSADPNYEPPLDVKA